MERETILNSDNGAFYFLRFKKKKSIIILRWFAIIATTCMVIFNRESTASWVAWYCIFFIISNIILSFLSNEIFKSKLFDYFLLCFDTLLVSVGIASFGIVNSDFYIFYYLIILFATTESNFLAIFGFCIILSAIYIWEIIVNGIQFFSLNQGFLLRIPFFQIAALYYGYLSERFKQEQKKLEEARSLSLTDPLTGLKNRRFLEECFPTEIGKAKRGNYPISIVMIDVDKFKSINDSFGHTTGDMVLREISAIFKANTRGSEYFIRYGGDEMLWLLCNTSNEMALKACQRLRENIEQYRFEKLPDLRVTVTCGITTFNHINMSSVSLSDIIDTLDQAFFKAKRKGGNRVISLDLKF